MNEPIAPVRRRMPAPARGFSLVEVLVSLIVIGVGMLGLAKIQALAYASTGTANLRSVAALESAGLVSAMRANRSYWSAVTTPFTITVTGGSFAASDSTLSTAGVNCQYGGANAPCSPALLAAYDVQQWVKDLNAVLPNVRALVNCPTPTAATLPVTCTIQSAWRESTVAINSQGAGNEVQTSLATINANGSVTAGYLYTLYVEP
jgi:type IV pilus assembly protein PilV